MGSELLELRLLCRPEASLQHRHTWLGLRRAFLMGRRLEGVTAGRDLVNRHLGEHIGRFSIGADDHP